MPREDGYKNLKPIQAGEVRNHTGKNGQSEAHAELMRILNEPGDSPDKTWLRLVVEETIHSALIAGRNGAADRKLLVEKATGKAAESHDLTNSDGSLGPKILEVRWVDAAKPVESTPQPVPDGTGTGTSGS